MVNYLADLSGAKTQALLVKGYVGYKQQADVNKNPAKAQEVEA